MPSPAEPGRRQCYRLPIRGRVGLGGWRCVHRLLVWSFKTRSRGSCCPKIILARMPIRVATKQPGTRWMFVH